MFKASNGYNFRTNIQKSEVMVIRNKQHKQQTNKKQINKKTKTKTNVNNDKLKQVEKLGTWELQLQQMVLVGDTLKPK